MSDDIPGCTRLRDQMLAIQKLEALAAEIARNYHNVECPRRETVVELQSVSRILSNKDLEGKR